jgi:hypothetical protein
MSCGQRFWAILLVCAGLFGQAPPPAQTPEGGGQKPADQTKPPAKVVSPVGQEPWKTLTPEEQAKLTGQIEKRDLDANGILVGAPKVYDDSLLQQMLSAAESRLSSLQAIDQASILSRLGSITGARQQITSLGISAQGLPLPQVATTANGQTSNVVATQKPDPTANSTVTTTNAPVTNVVTTSPQVSPPTVSAPSPSTTMPSAFSVSASDILDEQMQLTSEIANLRLLLEGSLNDWYMKEGMLASKPRITIGFPIALSADRRYKNAVAIVEVRVQTDPSADLSAGKTPPAITALLPREKTYNVAAITDRSFSLSLGMVTQIAGVSGSFLTGRKTYYLVKDQDTVARTFDAAQPSQTGFIWEFRPVLGREYVQTGLKQTFVQLAFPTPQAAGLVGQVQIRTYWRKLDPKAGILKEVIAGSVHESPMLPVSNFDLKQDTSGLSVQSLEDLGGGQMLVNVEGRFLGGTYVRVGSNILNTGSAGFTSEYRRIRFIASIADLATKNTALVSRDGTEMRLQINEAAPVVKDIKLTPLDETNSLLTIGLTSAPSIFWPPVLIIGGKVYGYSDAPISRRGPELSVALPTSTLISNRDVFLKTILSDDRKMVRISLFDGSVENERLVYLTQDQTPPTPTATFLLFGRGLTGVQAISPASAKLSKVSATADVDTLQAVTIPLAALKNQKELILQRSSESRPFFLAIPALPSAPSASADPKFQERVTVGADQATLTGDGLDQIDSASFGATALTISDKSAKSLKVSGLVKAGATAEAKTQEITFTSKSGTIKVNLEVVSQKVETVAK